MEPLFLKRFYKDIYNQCNPPGNVSSIDWKHIKLDETVRSIEVVKCIPLSTIFETAKVKYVDLFILDVEGAELSVLETIDWSAISFGVIAIEISDSVRHEGFGKEVRSFMSAHGYKFIEKRDRNEWFMSKKFVASSVHDKLSPQLLNEMDRHK
jgi:hypothetical protein